ncbi:hypothetical protein HOLleu_09348 [Holothuria leucospilota]|uniref:Ig-like domain-containing protein n=1 Tax=Holothuria leucospilota TaxID=206669 RepID=A0A9Q1HDV0_HOLLE|nr:hypothetical protein HOLleu_09348 [Holothuria leucospilota]
MVYCLRTKYLIVIFVPFFAADTPNPNTTALAYGTNVRFDCNISQNEEEVVWGRTTSKGYQLLYAGLNLIRATDANNIKLSHVNYSLFLNSVTIEDEGIYVCYQAPRTLASYRFKVEVNSEIRIQHEGHSLSERYFAVKGEELQLHCAVFRTRETPVIEWKVGNWTKKSGEMINSSNTFIEGTFDFRKTLTYVVKHDTEIICSSSSANNQSVLLKVFTAPFQNSGMYMIICDNYSLVDLGCFLSFLSFQTPCDNHLLLLN